MKRRAKVLGLAAVCVAAQGMMCAQGHGKAAGKVVAKPTFNRDVARILYANCVQCHHEGGSGPFALVNYEDARSHARQIADVTASRYMPPWLPDAKLPDGTESHIEGILRLSRAQIETLAEWAKTGAAEGNAADLTAVPKFSNGWELGQPDLVLKMDRSWTLPDVGIDRYRNFVFPVPIDTARYIKGVEIRPGKAQVIHHANVLIDTKEISRTRDGRDGQAGFEGMDVALETDAFEPDSHFLFWKPGSPARFEPKGMSWRLEPGTDLVLNMHMQPTGKPETVQPEIGLYFTDQKPAVHPMLLELERDEALDIPAGEKSFEVRDRFTMPVDVDVLAVYPHAHYLGKVLEGYAVLPDGKRKWLVRIGDWDQNWQGVYRFTQPVRLPRGSVVEMRYVYDNSGGNVRNPNIPPKRVRAGNQSTDEMAHFWMQVLPVAGETGGVDSRVILEEALMRHTLANNPNDFVAHYDLGAVLFSQKKTDAAVAEWMAAAKLKPEDAAVLTSLGTAYQSEGKSDAAVEILRRAVAANPSYVDAEYDLASILAGQGKIEEALEHFKRVVELSPKDADAEANLGTAYVSLGQIEEARRHYRRALEIDPGNALAKANSAALGPGGGAHR